MINYDDSDEDWSFIADDYNGNHDNDDDNNSDDYGAAIADDLKEFASANGRVTGDDHKFWTISIKLFALRVTRRGHSELGGLVIWWLGGLVTSWLGG